MHCNTTTSSIIRSAAFQAEEKSFTVKHEQDKKFVESNILAKHRVPKEDVICVLKHCAPKYYDKINSLHVIMISHLCSMSRLTISVDNLYIESQQKWPRILQQYSYNHEKVRFPTSSYINLERIQFSLMMLFSSFRIRTKEYETN